MAGKFQNSELGYEEADKIQNKTKQNRTSKTKKKAQRSPQDSRKNQLLQVCPEDGAVRQAPLPSFFAQLINRMGPWKGSQEPHLEGISTTLPVAVIPQCWALESIPRDPLDHRAEPWGLGERSHIRGSSILMGRSGWES